jgi:hypothetical protein
MSLRSSAAKRSASRLGKASLSSLGQRVAEEDDGELVVGLGTGRQARKQQAEKEDSDGMVTQIHGVVRGHRSGIAVLEFEADSIPALMNPA